MKVVPLISLLTLLTRCWSSQYIQSTSRTSLLPLEKHNYIIFENPLYDNELEQKDPLKGSKFNFFGDIFHKAQKSLKKISIL